MHTLTFRKKLFLFKSCRTGCRLTLLVFSLLNNTVATSADVTTFRENTDVGSGLVFTTQYFWISFGNFSANKESQFINPNDQSSWALSASGIFADTPDYQLCLDLELRYLSRKVDTTISPPLLGTIRNDTDIDTYIFAFGVRGMYPNATILKGYVSTGLAYYQSYMFVYGSQLGFPGKLEDDSSEINLYLGTGIIWNPQPFSISVDLRKFFHRASFGTFAINNADLGGTSLVLSVGRSWP